MKWNGVMTAITTGFKEDLTLDREQIAKHVTWLVDHGCTGIVANGTLGEATSLTREEKIQVLEICLSQVGDRVPVISGIGAMTTAQAVTLAEKAAKVGCSALMVLPPYQYSTDWYEMKAHVAAVISATKLPCMLYNDPVAYGTDFLPENIAQLAQEYPNLVAVKESTTDVRRITAIRALVGERLSIVVGMDDVLLEGITAGATAWVAGTANALPQESVNLFNYAIQGQYDQAFQLYKWLMPLMRLNAVPKFVQMTKLMQKVVGLGNTFVRPPRLELTKTEYQAALNIINTVLSQRPSI
ncbi:dihydrodipicolinate synthase family protein [Crocosphaera sp. XPORK-15E]|uniref:dihydrodipicolinate synthase family protein n=1 Tax=Crocosphaera sp. XPORK-15E TaxID=3110247 RepID=UPI002B2007C0|nr:dihydrodipicolinate synthase family protein [Crocosphaera sp. XPORK-15E]MEA5536955.1 dihydrodipicolinate synthase family protein [Crocosphaera sp. XPORK-15E]